MGPSVSVVTGVLLIVHPLLMDPVSVILGKLECLLPDRLRAMESRVRRCLSWLLERPLESTPVTPLLH